MKILLDTNIIIHREAYKMSNLSIGQLFNWLDRLKYTKCIHPITQKEILSHNNPETAKSMSIKLQSYYLLKTVATFGTKIQELSKKNDKDQNDINDSILLNEVLEHRVDHLITEDKKIHAKAKTLGIDSRVCTISQFVEKLISENPELVDYKVLSIQKKYFGDIDINNAFFDSFRQDYAEFDKWFTRKAEEIAYVCYSKKWMVGFLYIKLEEKNENYSDISPSMKPRRRLKIGTLKVDLNGYKMGERFLKIVFDNALLSKAEEIYVTIFDKSSEQVRLIELLEEWGFLKYGVKETLNGSEQVYVRDFTRKANLQNPKLTFPYISKKADVFFCTYMA